MWLVIFEQLFVILFDVISLPYSSEESGFRIEI